MNVLNFHTDWVYGNPTSSQIEERMTVMKDVVQRVNTAKGISFPSGIRFEGTAAVIGVLASDPVRRSSDAIAYMQGFADEAGIRFPKEIANGMAGIDPSFIFDFKDTEISAWVGNASQLVTTSMDKGGMLAGGALKGAFDVVGALADGNVSADDAKKLATAGGAAVGGAIGSIIPGIGTAIGAFIGSTIGALVSEIADWINPPQPDFGSAITGQREALDTYFYKLKNVCSEQEAKILTETIYPGVLGLSDFWHNVELTLGFRFPLRWFRNNPGLQFELQAYLGNWDQGVPPYLGAHPEVWGRAALLQAQAGMWNIPGPPNPAYGAYQCEADVSNRQLRGAKGVATYTGKEFLGTCNFYCPQQILGCLYPNVRSNAFGPYRVLDALRARNFDMKNLPSCTFINPAAEAELSKTKAECERKFGKDSGSAVSKMSGSSERVEAQEQACVDYVWDLAKRQGSAKSDELSRFIMNYKSAERVVHADLLQTSNLMHSQLRLFRDKLQLMQPTVVNDAGTAAAAGLAADAQAKKQMFMLGGAALAAVAFFGSRR